MIISQITNTKPQDRLKRVISPKLNQSLNKANHNVTIDPNKDIKRSSMNPSSNMNLDRITELVNQSGVRV